jgi:O-antigen ligase
MVGMRVWKDNFFLGVGAGNFLPKLPEYQTASKFYWLQPIHNIFLLAGVEVGMLGIILIIYLFSGLGPKVMNRKNWVLIGIIVLTGMVDHYWITLPQNSWLLAVVLSIL